MANVNNLENWSGPFKTKQAAIEDIILMCGTGYEAAIWQIGKKFYVNDGIDSDTGKEWVSLPKGAEFLEITEEMDA